MCLKVGQLFVDWHARAPVLGGGEFLGACTRQVLSVTARGVQGNEVERGPYQQHDSDHPYGTFSHAVARLGLWRKRTKFSCRPARSRPELRRKAEALDGFRMLRYVPSRCPSNTERMKDDAVAEPQMRRV